VNATKASSRTELELTEYWNWYELHLGGHFLSQAAIRLSEFGDTLQTASNNLGIL
jgi:hypothetical protein